ncbi:MAG: hypothetical protein FJY07_06230 [Bacteroidetes bacterium]|nr:hypothetical protein [Bacteroidota bacterium]
MNNYELKMAKNRLYILNLAVLFVLGLQSCTEDDLINPVDDRQAFIGTWNVTETCVKDAYTVTIEADPSNSAQVIINNFWLIGFQEKPPYAIVAGSSITIPNQTMCNDGSNTVSGSGLLKNGKIEWDYTVNDGADLFTCSAIYEPQ